MDLSSPATFWTAYTACNMLAMAALLVCLEKPLLGRLLYSLLFGLSCVLQVYVAFFKPDVYTALAAHALLPLYKSFILESFSAYTLPLALAIATLQLWVALSIWGKGWLFRGGIVVAILLLVLLLPLGLGAAFPAPLNLAIGLRLLLRRQPDEYLWPALFERYLKTKDHQNV